MWIPIAIAGMTVLAAYTFMSGPSNTTQMKGSDGKVYEVQNLPDKETAVEHMTDIHGRLIKLQEYYRDDPALASDPPVSRFLARFQPDVMIENDMSSSDTSYSENKGQKIVVCLRDKTKPPQYPLIEINTVMFVMLHEMAHLITETIGHTPEFWANFRRILHDAVKVGIYQHVSYASNPTPYCGMQITDSPLG